MRLKNIVANLQINYDSVQIVRTNLSNILTFVSIEDVYTE